MKASKLPVIFLFTTMIVAISTPFVKSAYEASVLQKAEEIAKKEKAKADSIAAVEKAIADSIAAAKEKAAQDSILKSY